MKKYILLVPALLLVGCSQSANVFVEPVVEDTDRFVDQPFQDAVMISEQKAGKVVTIESVTLYEDSFIVVRQLVDGNPGKTIGVSNFLPKGEQLNISITLDKSYPAATRLGAYIHKDNGDKKFVDTQDFPVLDDQKAPVKLEILLTK